MWTWSRWIYITNFYPTKTRWFQQVNTEPEKLNGEMPYIHFRMEKLQSILELIIRGSFMASLDLKDAYYSIPINPDHTKYLKFTSKGQWFKFPVLPNGLCSENSTNLWNSRKLLCRSMVTL